MATILVVDDDHAARELMKTVLRYDGHQVYEAEDGAEALLLVHRLMPTLIVVDLLMPKMDGMEFVRRLRRHSATSSIPVIFYTASYLESQVQSLAQLCGVTHIISKPAEPEQIFAVINAALGQKQASLPKPAPVEAQQDYLAGLTAALSRKAAQVVPRLEAMVALGLRLASERDPHRLLADFCEAARKIVGARIALVAVRHEGDASLRYQFTSGDADERMDAIEPALWNSLPYREALSEREPRLVAPIPDDLPLPPSLKHARALLCVPILSPQRAYGWLTLLDAASGQTFNEEDIALARILAAQVGRIYENGSLYTEIKHYAERLEKEVVERRQAQEEIKKLNTELERRIEARTAELVALNKELEAFGYTVSHDLRAPLRAVIGFSTMVLDSDGTQLSENSRRLLRQSIESAQRMGRMVDDLLEFSRKGRQGLKPQVIDMTELVKSVWSEQVPAGQGEVQLRLDELAPARADVTMMREVWMNLLSNAVKYSRNVSQPVVAVRSEQREGFVKYSVQDNGVGFDARYSEKLFRVFERLHTEAEFEGTGVGLAIVERVVSRHGGKVSAMSQPGRGATFAFTLPVGDDAAHGRRA